MLLAGLARDGGLYVPAAWPRFSAGQIAGFAGQCYADVALAVMRPFIGADVSEAELKSMVSAAYATFGHAAVAPLVQIGPGDWMLELFHGPTLAFKDIAMQMLGRLMDRTLSAHGRRATIVGATSGDTGGAAIEAFRGRSAIDIFILFPQGRVSDVQRRQMTTPTEVNVHAIAVKGTFDDCQNIVKAMFNDLELRDRLQLAGVNSINWARIMAQVVYYFTAAVALGSPHRKVSFSVPTGNFGDIFAGYVAWKMGLPIERLIIATNANDILVRTLTTGRYEPKGAVATTSPSMDIQISSNFERLLFELTGRDAARVRQLMNALSGQDGFVLKDAEMTELRSLFSAHRADESAVQRTIAELYKGTGYLADPHTAVGIAAAKATVRAAGVPVVTLATAHPAKFPQAVMAAAGVAPLEPVSVRAQKAADERFVVLPNDITAIARYVTSRTRASMPPTPSQTSKTTARTPE